MTADERRRTEPSWCNGKHSHGPNLPLHQSEKVEVGKQPRYRGDGLAVCWLESAAEGPVKVGIQAAHMATATVAIDLVYAKQFHAELGRLIDQAERG